MFLENTTEILIKSLRNKKVTGIAITERPFLSYSSSYSSPNLCFTLSISSLLKLMDSTRATIKGAARHTAANKMKKAEFVISPTESNVT
jgi:hypothetical protein